jgi:hypothetical protein
MSFEKALRGKVGTRYRKTRGKNGQEFRINCPFCVKNGHSPDKSYKMYINPTKNDGIYHCVRCGSSGSTRKLLGWVGVQTKPEAPRAKARNDGNIRMPGSLIPLNMLEEEHPAIQYVTKQRSRYFDPKELASYYAVAYCHQGVKFGDGVDFMYDTTGTLIFPIFNKGKLIGWQSRMMTEPKELTDAYLEHFGYPKNADGEWILPPKYFTSPGFPKGEVMFNFDVAREREPVVVTEGVFDAMAVGLSGVALLGKGITETQLRILQTYCDNVVILLDPDAGSESSDMVKILRRTINVKQVTLQGYKDPGDAPTEEIWRQITGGSPTPPMTQLQTVLGGMN